MSAFFDLHVHTEFCDGKSTAEEMVEAGRLETDESGGIAYDTDGAPIIIPPVYENILNG